MKVKVKVKEKLNEIFAGRNEIHLFAVDVGSRNWEVHNHLSDHDIKGFYIRSKGQLFDFNYIPKTINAKSNEFDFICYEFDDFFQRINNNNPTVFEILRSNFTIISEIDGFESFRKKVIEHLDLHFLANAYSEYGKKNLINLEKNGNVDYKKIFLTIRPLLYAELLRNEIIPETSFLRLLDQIKKEHPFYELAKTFIVKKSLGNEKEILPQREVPPIMKILRTCSNTLTKVKHIKNENIHLEPFLKEFSYNFKSAFYEKD